MTKVLKAKVISGRHAHEIVRITNISLDEIGRQKAACLLSNGTRANILVSDLELLEDKGPQPEIRKAKTASMPFISGSTSSRTMTHTKNMAKPRVEIKVKTNSQPPQLAFCESCGEEYDLQQRREMPGKITQCEACAEETESKVEGTMVFSHKTGATIEIKKDGELLHEAPIFDPKNKT